VAVSRIEVPGSAADVASAVASWQGQVAVGGGRYSMGGQIGVKGNPPNLSLTPCTPRTDVA
jgi:hypothetical protein